MRAHVSFAVDVPDDVTVSKDDVREMLWFQLHWKNEIALKHPLASWEIEPCDEPLVSFDW